MESLNSLQLFVQVAESRSFVAAGRALGISASAVGKAIARLEERMKVRLFHRNTRSITLTTGGVLFLERCRRIQAEMEAAEQELLEIAQQPRGRLRLSLPLIGSLMLPLLGQFMQRYPDIQLDLDFTDRKVEVIEEGFDAVLRTGVPSDSSLHIRRIGEFTSHLVGSPDYFARHGTPQIPADLLNHRCLHFRFPNSGKLESWPLYPPLESPLPVAMVCNNIETRLCFAMQGLGIACLPQFSIQQALASGELVTILDAYVDRRVTLSILWPHGGEMAPRLRVFIDFISAGLRSQMAP